MNNEILLDPRQATEWERTNDLLKKIYNAMNSLPNQRLHNTAFKDTYQIASTIYTFLKEAE